MMDVVLVALIHTLRNRTTISPPKKWRSSMIIYVLDDGETWTLSEPTPVAVTPEQLTRIEGGEKVYSVFPDWDKLHPPCNCIKCTQERRESRIIIQAQNEAINQTKED
tara:strand:- start:692 stop:1015 length:324 start_codon:yes stop_codon:yes gene_type:complete